VREFSREFRIVDTADEFAIPALECERLGAPARQAIIFRACKNAGKYTRSQGLIDHDYYKTFHTSVPAEFGMLHARQLALRDQPTWPQRARALA
jgi:hypothetical protein